MYSLYYYPPAYESWLTLPIDLTVPDSYLQGVQKNFTYITLHFPPFLLRASLLKKGSVHLDFVEILVTFKFNFSQKLDEMFDPLLRKKHKASVFIRDWK